MQPFYRIGLVAVSGVLLSGCSLFGGHQTSSLNAESHAELATAQEIAEIQLEVGRENLAEGNLATAARYLQGARMHPTTRADATNALGVVYVRLGRLDVASRYFSEALEIEPGNARFATNLARLEGDISFARARAREAQGEAGTEVALASLQALETQDLPVAATQRRQRQHVIHIQTASAGEQAAPRMEVYAGRPVVQMAERDTSKEDVAAAESEGTGRRIIEYPISMRFSDEPAEYPVRVEI